MFVAAKQENGFRGTNSCIKCTPIQIFATGRATKWHETIQNMSFRPKAVDWACLLQKKTRNGSGGINSCIKCTSIPVFASIKECLELLVNFMNKILIHKTFKAIIC